MKLRRCEWMPSSVAEWLSNQLEELGVPGTTYSHALLSLLHPIFCPHPLPQDQLGSGSSNHLGDSFSAISCLSSCLTEEVESLFDPIEDFIHPDADFPLLTGEHHKKKNIRLTKKKQRNKLRGITPEKECKEAALQFLLTASDERVILQELVDELFLRLRVSDNIKLVGEIDIERCHKNLDARSIESVQSSIETNEGASCLTGWKRSLNFDSQSPSTNKKSVWNSKDCCVGENLKNLNTNEPPANEFFSQDHSNNESLFLQSFFEERFNLKGRVGNSDCVEMDYGPNILNDNQLGIDEPFITEMRIQENEKRNSMEEWEHAGGLFSPSVSRPGSDIRNRLFERNVSSTEPTGFSSHVGGLVDSDEVDGERGLSSLSEWKNERSETQGSQVDVQVDYYAENRVHPDDFPTDLHTSDGIHPFEDSMPVTTISNSVPIEWNPLALNTPKGDPLFSSAFSHSPHSALKGMFGDDLKVPWGETIGECSIPCREQHVQQSEFNNGAMFDSSGTNFHQSQLLSLQSSQEHLQPPIFDENIDFIPMVSNIGAQNDFQKEDSWNLSDHVDIANVNSEKTSDFADSESLCESFQQLGLEHLWKELPLNPNMDSVKEITTSKPTGPYDALEHDENSVFSTIVPPNISKDNVISKNSLAKDLSIMNTGSLEELDKNVDTLKIRLDENLLTSPRTHFKPIDRDPSKIQNAKRALCPTKTDGETVPGLETSEMNVKFRRTNSGTLYLENDKEGSPKRYMVYREPSQKASSDFQRLDDLSIYPYEDESQFFPKFEVANHEKFSQTEIEGEKPTFLKSPSFSQMYNPGDENMPQNLSFKIWKNSSLSEVMTPWPDKFEPNYSSDEPLSIPPNVSNWSNILNNQKQDMWNNDRAQFGTDPADVGINISNLFNVDNFQSLPNTLLEATTPDFGQSDGLAKVKFLWNDNGIGVKNRDLRTISIEESGQCDSVFSSNEKLSSEEHSEPFVTFQDSNWPHHHDENKILASDLWENKGADNIYSTLEYTKITQDTLSVPSHWKLKQEVDLEADEILGGLLPSSHEDSPYQLEYVNEDVGHDGEYGFMDLFDNTDANATYQQQQPIEDLDHLAPGWDLCEGFEWDASAAANLPPEEEETPGDVLVYETEDGQTLFLPIEYLEDAFYDQIFGASGETQIGGSLPDLPNQGGLKRSGNISRRYRSKAVSLRKPCCFFLEGNCRRSDCKYTHDLSTITCRFWEESDCLKGDTCPFRHGHAMARRRNRSEGDNVSFAPNSLTSKINRRESKGKAIPKSKSREVTYRDSFEIDSETDFPCLGSSVDSKSEDSGLGSKVKAVKKKKKRKYITVTKSLFKEIENEHGHCFVSKSGRKIRSKNFPSSEGIFINDEEKKEPQSLMKLLKKRDLEQNLSFDYEDGSVSDY